MNLNSGWTELNAALKTLREHWEEVQRAWDDAVRRDFEEKHYRPLEAQVLATLRAMDRLAPILRRAQRECT